MAKKTKRDFFGSFRRRTAAPTRTVGVSGTAVHGGYIQENEKNADLVGPKKYTTFSNMLSNVSIVAAGVRHFLNLVSKSEWSVEPPMGKAEKKPEPKNPTPLLPGMPPEPPEPPPQPEALPGSEEIAEAIQNSMDNMSTPWHRVIRRAAMYRFYGFSLQEWTASRKPADGKTFFRDIAPRPQSTIEKWDTDEKGRVYGVVQRSPQDYREIWLPRKKLIYVVDDSLNDSPEGHGLFRDIAETARTLRRFEQLEGQGFESDLQGIPIGRAPLAYLQELVDDGKISKAQKALLEAPMVNFIQNHIRSSTTGLLLDSITYQSEDDAATPSAIQQWSLEVLKAGNTTQAAIGSTIERKTREIARVLGVEQLLLGDKTGGSNALSRDKTQMFAAIVQSTMIELAKTFEKDYLDPLFALNGWAEELKPTLRPKSINLRDILQVTQSLKDMASAGAKLHEDDPAIIEVRDLLGLSRPTTIKMTPDPPPFGAENKPPFEEGRANEEPDHTPEKEGGSKK